jgi:dihydrofolate reductase
VVTHYEREPLTLSDTTFTFVTDGIERALASAREVAGDKRIGLMGADIDQQFLAAGLVDEIRIHLVNVLLGGGRRLFDHLPQRIELEQTGLGETDGVTHLEYRVVR